MDNKPSRGAPELYQLMITLLGLVLVLFVGKPPRSILTTSALRWFIVLIAAYPIFDLVIFSLDWIFVAKEPLESYRRSLATFLVNVVQVALFFALIVVFADCVQGQSAFSAAWLNVKAIIGLNLVEVGQTATCTTIAHSQWLVAALLMSIIVGSLVGEVARQERGED